jgi:hypothetical protein
MATAGIVKSAEVLLSHDSSQDGVLCEQSIASREILKYRSFDIFNGDTDKHKTVSFNLDISMSDLFKDNEEVTDGIKTNITDKSGQ